MKTCALLSAAVLCALTADAFAQRSLSVQVPTARQLARFGLERAWASQATIEIGRDVVRHLVLDEDNLYVQSSGGTVTAFDNETGEKRWAVQLGNKDEPSFAATSNEELVLVIAGIHSTRPKSGLSYWNPARARVVTWSR